MKASSFREQEVSELQRTIADLRRQKWKSRFSNYAGQLDNTAEIKRHRRDIARALTVLQEKRTEAGESGRAAGAELTEKDI